MPTPKFLPAFQRIEQNFKHVQEVVIEQAMGNAVRVQAMYMQFENALSVIYQSGEGWIVEDIQRILEALQFAAHKHQAQVRKDKAQTSYLIHPLSVTHHLMTMGKVRDPDIILASLLHDTLEDTRTLYQELVYFFGERVANFVQEVTDDQNLPKEERKRLQILTAPYKSAGAAQIKLADKWDNLTDLLNGSLIGWSEERIQTYFEWAKEVVDALPWVNAALLKAVEKLILKKVRVKSSE